MRSLRNHPFNFLQFPALPLLVVFSSLSGIWIAAAEDPFVDEFAGPELDASWIIFDNEGDTHEGFTGDGEYEIVDSQSTADAGLGRSMSGSGDFTADVSVRLQDFFEGPVDFKFRFLAPKFMELVFNQNDFMRVFSGERGGNTVTIPAFGYEEGTTMHIRFSWTEAAGTMRVGVGLQDEPMQLITTIDGLEGFQPTRTDLVLFRIGEGDHSPRLFIDRFEIKDEALPVGIPPFVDEFSGPELAEGWTPLDNEDGATQIGFSDGIYEIRDNQQGGRRRVNDGPWAGPEASPPMPGSNSSISRDRTRTSSSDSSAASSWKSFTIALMISACSPVKSAGISAGSRKSVSPMVMC